MGVSADPTPHVWCPELDAQGDDAAASVSIWMPELPELSPLGEAEPRGRGQSMERPRKVETATATAGSRSRSRSRSRRRSKSGKNAPRKQGQRKAQPEPGESPVDEGANQEKILQGSKADGKPSPGQERPSRLSPAALLQNEIVEKLEAVVDTHAPASARKTGTASISASRAYEDWEFIRVSIRHLKKSQAGLESNRPKDWFSTWRRCGIPSLR